MFVCTEKHFVRMVEEQDWEEKVLNGIEMFSAQENCLVTELVHCVFTLPKSFAAFFLSELLSVESFGRMK